MKKIKVLELIMTTELGGAEVNLLNLLSCLDKNKFEIHVGYTNGGGLQPLLQSMDVKLFKYSDIAYKILSFGTFFIIFKLVVYILRNRVDIIHTHISNAQIWGGIAAKITGCRLIEHVHDFRYSMPVDYKKRLGKRNKQFKHFKRMRNFSDTVIVLTTEYYNFLIKNKLYPPNKVVRIPNGIRVLECDPAKRVVNKANLCKQLALPLQNLIVFTSCRTEREKNLGLILRIAGQVRDQVPNAIFVIAGSGSLLEYYRNECKRNELEEYVKFIGYRPDVMELLKGVDLYLLPSLLELQSVAIIEAMSCGAPVIISKGVGCNDDFITNWANGVLLDPFSDEGWAEAIVKLLKEEELRKRIGNNGYQTCKEQFDIKKTVRDIEELYVQLASQ